MNKETCPRCGFLAHRICSNDGKHWKYVCERCEFVFCKDERIFDN